MNAMTEAKNVVAPAQDIDKDRMAMANRNKEFLSVIHSDTKAEIIKSIAVHYETTSEKVFAEVTSLDAEHLLEYMVEPKRTPTSLLMQSHGMRGW
jgi:hypothetical protein